MAQRKSEQETTLQQVMRLASQLTPEEQDQVIEELKLQWLRRETQKAEDELSRGEGRPAEEVFAKLIERYARRKGSQ